MKCPTLSIFIIFPYPMICEINECIEESAFLTLILVLGYSTNSGVSQN